MRKIDDTDYIKTNKLVNNVLRKQNAFIHSVEKLSENLIGRHVLANIKHQTYRQPKGYSVCKITDLGISQDGVFRIYVVPLYKDQQGGLLLEYPPEVSYSQNAHSVKLSDIVLLAVHVEAELLMIHEHDRAKLAERLIRSVSSKGNNLDPNQIRFVRDF